MNTYIEDSSRSSMRATPRYDESCDTARLKSCKRFLNTEYSDAPQDYHGQQRIYQRRFIKLEDLENSDSYQEGHSKHDQMELQSEKRQQRQNMEDILLCPYCPTKCTLDNLDSTKTKPNVGTIDNEYFH